MDPGTADVVRARTQLGNAAVTAALGGLPRGPESRPSAWTVQMMLAGQNLVGNQAIASQATAPSATTPAVPAGLTPVPPAPLPVTPPSTPAPKKPPPAKPTGLKADAPSAGGPDKKDLAAKDKSTKERPEKGSTKEKGSGPRSPGADPKFQALKKDVNTKKKAVGSSHPPAAAEAGAAQDAAEAPADDQEARGKAAHADDMDAAQPKEFNKQEFVNAVKKAIADKAPKNLDEADKFGESGKAEEVKTEVQGKVGEGKDASAQEIAETTAAPPEPAPDAKQVVPMAADKVPGKPGTPNPAQAAPDQLPSSATDLSAGPDQVNQQMAEAKVTEQQLSFDNAREPQFDKAVKEKKSMEAHSEAAPKKLRAEESGELNQVKKTAATQGAAAMAGIHGIRAATGQQVGSGKAGTKSKDEDKRKQVTDLLQMVFDQTKSEVEKILTDLDKKVDDQFGTKEKRARDRFTVEHEDGMRRYKADRYGGWDGPFLWAKDIFLPLPDEANRIYERARDNYLAAMDQIITEIADTVEAELKRAKDRIAAGRKELKAAVDKLPADLKAIGREAATEFEGKFDELKDTVNEKGTELVDTLATKYTEAVKSVDEEIAKEKEKNKGLVANAADAIGGAIKAIIELGRMLLGILRKAATAVGAILKDPIGFLGNLVTGVGGGLKLFMKNAGRHLEAGVMAWLLGISATAGLQLPASFDILGILTVIAMILGLSWPNIRDRLSRRVPPQALMAAETSVPLVSQVKRRGVAGMWDDLKTRVGDLKKTLIKDLVSFLLPTIIIAGITWIVSLFNPASAFIRACKMIIDIIRFIVMNARQIIDFVNAVLDAVIAIARGGTGGVPALVERALARSIPVLIGALAALLGIGGIAGKVKQIFQKLARPVNRAIDWVINKIVGLIKKLWEKIKPKAKPRPRKPKRPAARGRPGRPRPKKRRPPPRRKRPDARRPRKRGPDRRDDKREKQMKRALERALRDARRLLNDDKATPESVQRGLPRLKHKHRLTSIRLVPVAGGEKYYIELSINPGGRTEPEVLGDFPFEVDKAVGSVKITRVGAAVNTLRKIRIPMRGKDPAAGFVINMVTIPDGVTERTAGRYADEAWRGASSEAVALAQVAVVLGINTAESISPREAKAAGNPGPEGVKEAVQRARVPEKRLLMAAFGFLWTPRWYNKETGARASIEEVRAKYRALPESEREKAIQKERGLRDKGKLPYGPFREEVTGSTYTAEAMRFLAEVNNQVHMLVQDADGGVVTPGEDPRGVLAVYDAILREAKQDATLRIGGYTFEGFDWGPNANERTVQLTLLANELDRAVRAAVAKVHPEMLYPTEPNLLVKLWDRDQRDGIFQNLQLRAQLEEGRHRARDEDPLKPADPTRPPMWGYGGVEGRHFRDEMRGAPGQRFSVAHSPEASTPTSPAPGDEDRGLEVTEQIVGQYNPTTGRRKKPIASDPRDPSTRQPSPLYALIMQKQSYAAAHALAREFARVNRLGNDSIKRLQTKIFIHVQEVIKLMAADPNLTVESGPVQNRLRMLEAAVQAAGEGPEAGPDELRQHLETAHSVTREIINALTAPELRGLWTRIKQELSEIGHPPR